LRYRRRAQQERTLFAPGSDTHILLPTDARSQRYRELYNTPPERLHLLPPGLGPDRRLAEKEDTAARRRRLRADLGLEPQEYTLLFIGSGFAAGGLDRVITTLAHIKEEQPSVKSRLLVVGPDKPGRFRLQARRLKVADAVSFLGGREDVVDLMLAADLLVYPALVESTGIVLLEALSVGLPCVAAEHCGYAEHVKAGRAGILLPSPFSHEHLHRAVMRYMDGIFRADCRESGRRYAVLTDLGSMYREGAGLLQRLVGPGS
jgi:UDP-glucose:(heptosyl)LPS alpha-1,3-glucosyltransferase